MPLIKAARYSAGTILVLAALTQPLFAQTSIGFENPNDTTNILEYRLPDWGYRTWDLGFDLNGFGGETYHGDVSKSDSNRMTTGLNSRFHLFRESDPRTYNLFVDADGTYNKSSASTNSREQSGHRLNGNLWLGGDWTRYFGDGPFSLSAAGNTRQTYTENIQEMVSNVDSDEIRQYRRENSYLARVGAGVGRVRDVTPLIRAQRLSERLTSLGRVRLDPAQVQEVALALATEHGYRAVFDRPDRSFWRDVLEPMLNPDQPLTTYEVFYLRDVMEEDIGPRGEGFEIRGSYFYRNNQTEKTDNDLRYINRGPALDLMWVRNLTFDHQLTLAAGVDYSSESRHNGQGDFVTGVVDLSHLWTIADRYRWDTSLLFDGEYHELSALGERRIDRELVTRLQSAFTIFLENSLSLNLRVRGSNIQEYMDTVFQGYDERYSRRWSWSYGIGFQYYLDRFLY